MAFALPYVMDSLSFVPLLLGILFFASELFDDSTLCVLVSVLWFFAIRNATDDAFSLSHTILPDTVRVSSVGGILLFSRVASRGGRLHK